ncbi:hypothetical protein ACKVMT_10465 [Halobacteriales archaeon Cl-PHB]
MVEIPLRPFGVLGVLGLLGAWTNEPALFALFALGGLFEVDRTIELPPSDSSE